MNIEYINIEITSLTKNILLKIIPNELKVILPTKEKNITKEKIYDLLRIIREWNNKTNNDTLLDSEEYTIKIKTQKEITILHNKGTYPKNYNEFLDWIGDIYE